MNEQQGYDIEELTVGMSASFAKTITEADILLFAAVSGDTNSMHVNEELARKTQFGGRIAHGILSAGLISAVIGNKLPGPGSIYVSQTLKFKAPVRIGDTVCATAKITEVHVARRRVVIATQCLVGEKVVIDGEAVVLCTSKQVANKH